MKTDSAYLNHIMEAIQSINKYLKEYDYNAFDKDKKTIDAVVRELEIIGEAASNLSDEFRNKHLEFPFREMVDMRNILIHEYFGVNTKIVWDTCLYDLPSLKTIVGEILENAWWQRWTLGATYGKIYKYKIPEKV